jgi:hypothetical protein
MPLFGAAVAAGCVGAGGRYPNARGPSAPAGPGRKIRAQLAQNGQVETQSQ